MFKRLVCLALVIMATCGRVEIALAQTSLSGLHPAEPAGGLTAKRLGSAKVEPVIIGTLRFEAIQWGKERGLAQNGGYIAAYDTRSGNEMWLLKVYDIPYDSALESDVQDVFIVSMSKAFFSGKLNIEDEKGRKYTVDPETRKVEPRTCFFGF